MKRIYIVGLLAVIVYSSNIWGISIYILDEAKNAVCAMEMLQRSDIVVPTFNNELRTDKPPLHYYMMMLGYSFFGVSAFSARLFSVLAGVALVVYLHRKVSLLVNEKAAWITSLVMLASLQLTVQFHMAVPDPYLILFLTITCISFYEVLTGSKRAVYPLYISAALGFLTKGPVAIVIPGLSCMLFMLLTKRFNLQIFKRLQPVKGLFLFAVVALPWYAAVGLATDGEWLRGFFLQHNVSRFTSTMEGHRGNFFVPALYLAAGLMPFSVFALHAIRTTWQNRIKDNFVYFSLLVAFVVVCFFSLSKTMLPGYIGPAIPFMAVVLGYYLSSDAWAKSQKSKNYLFVIAMLIMLAIPAGLYFGLAADQVTNSIKWYALLLLVLPVFMVAGWLYWHRSNNLQWIGIWSTGCIIAWLLFFYAIYPAADRLNPVMASKSVREGYPGYRTVAYGVFNPAFVFDYRKPIPRYSNPDSLASFSKGEAGKVMIFTRAKYLNEINATGNFNVIFRLHDLFEQSETVILTN